MDPNSWFNISRIATIIGGTLTVFGGFGLWHFGQLKDTSTNLKIKTSEENAKKAIADAASANSKTKELELDIIDAKKETELAKERTQELSLQVAEANAMAEQAKLERKKLENETNKLNRGNVSYIKFNGDHFIRGGNTIKDRIGGTEENKVYSELLKLNYGGNFSQMIELANKQIELRPDWLTPYLFKAVGLINLQKRGKAIPILEYIEQKAPNDIDYLVEIIKAYKHLGLTEKVNKLVNSFPEEKRHLLLKHINR